MKRQNQYRRVFRLVLLVAACLFSQFSYKSSGASDQITAKPELVIQTGHSSRVNCVAFGPDSHWLASGSADNSIRLWDVESGLELRALIGHQNWIRSLAVSKNGKRLASGSNDRTVKVWNVASGRLELDLAGHEGAVEAVLFSPDGRLIVSGGADNSVKVWDATSGRQLQTLKDQAAAVTALVMSPDGRTLASASADGKIRIWNTPDWTLVRTLERQPQRINALSFSPDSRMLASASANELIFWDTANGKLRFTIKQAFLAVSFAGANELKTGNVEGAITSWDATTGKEKSLLTGPADAPESLFAAFSPDGKYLASGSGNRSVDLRSVRDGKLTRTLASHSAAFFSIAFSRDGRWLASGANDHTIRLWQIATGREMPKLSGHSGWVQAIAFSPDSRQIASGSNSGEVKLWDLNTGRQTFTQSYAGDRIQTVAFSPDGKWLASSGTGQVIHALDLVTKQTRNLTGHEAEITSLAFIPRSDLLLSAGTDKTIKLWDLATGSIVRTLASLTGQVNSLAVSPDGSFLAAGTADKLIELLPINSGASEGRRTLKGHTGEIFTLAFSADGRWLASAGLDENIKLWDYKTGQEFRSLAANSGEINSLDFSHDSRFLVAANKDGSMTVWHAESGTVAATVVSVPNHDDWLVVTPGGLFDGSHAAWKLLLWRFAQTTFNVAPVESFFNEFYYPGLLSDVLANKSLRAKQDIVNKDRRQPRVTLQTVNPNNGPISDRTIQLRLDIDEAPAEGVYANGSGARDLRLFRNGLLVEAWPGDVLQGGAQRTVEATVPIVAGENTFTAYAFNRDNVKSSDAELTVAGAEKLRRSGTAYLFVVGVGKYANSQYNLNYSVADATAIAAQLKSQQELLRRYQPVEVISLLNEDATKDNILLGLKLLAGTFTGPLPQNAAADLAKVKAAQPEDALIFYFSGHGTANGDRFYLIPHDLGYLGRRSDLDASGLDLILSHSVSDLELEAALKPLDVDQLLLVIDACNSGQALHADEERRGPMNTRGLAQLAYEKGMYVLTASQSDEVAFESAGLKHSYLAYALVEEGIKSGAADYDRDGQVFLSEWFNYATDRVPKIRGQKQQGGKQLEEVDEDEKRVQRPRVFNMREGGAERFVIARIGANAKAN